MESIRTRQQARAHITDALRSHADWLEQARRRLNAAREDVEKAQKHFDDAERSLRAWQEIDELYALGLAHEAELERDKPTAGISDPAYRHHKEQIDAEREAILRGEQPPEPVSFFDKPVARVVGEGELLLLAKANTPCPQAFPHAGHRVDLTGGAAVGGYWCDGTS